MNLSKEQDLRSFLKKYGLNPQKGLGQHFLCSEPIVSLIAASVSEANGILEIGPGPGVLTHRLAESHAVTALEIDPLMERPLRELSPNIRPVIADALKTDWAALISELPQPVAIVSNMPYYITAPLLNRCADHAESICRAVVMMQKEAAERVKAKPGDSARGSLSVYLQSIFSIESAAIVPPTAFLPPPKVESEILVLIPKKEEPLPEEFWQFVRKGFQQPRKTLANNLEGWKGSSKETVTSILSQAELDLRIRPHFLTFEQWSHLYRLTKTS